MVSYIISLSLIQTRNTLLYILQMGQCTPQRVLLYLYVNAVEHAHLKICWQVWPLTVSSIKSKILDEPFNPLIIQLSRIWCLKCPYRRPCRPRLRGWTGTRKRACLAAPASAWCRWSKVLKRPSTSFQNHGIKSVCLMMYTLPRYTIE